MTMPVHVNKCSIILIADQKPLKSSHNLTHNWFGLSAAEIRARWQRMLVLASCRTRHLASLLNGSRVQYFMQIRVLSPSWAPGVQGVSTVSDRTPTEMEPRGLCPASSESHTVRRWLPASSTCPLDPS